MSARQNTPLFSSLAIHDWRQFDHVELVLHDRLTVITGANAAGKTTLLSMLAQHFGWSWQFVGTPARKRQSGVMSFLSGLWRRRGTDEDAGQVQVGEIGYSNGQTSHLLVPDVLGGATFNVQFSGLQGIGGLFIPSHRPTFAYQPVGQIPTTLLTRQQILDQYLGEIRTRYTGQSSGYTPAYRLKEALISLATFGYGNKAVDPNPEAVELYEGFSTSLREVLPPSLGFRNLVVRVPEVVLETDTGDFSLDSVSGGVASIIDLTFQIYMRALDFVRFVVVIDEPENHLHPELQRTLLPGFLRAFPNAQFVVATHNPFIVGSVPDSNVYVLRYADVERLDPETRQVRTESKVQSVLLDRVNKAGSSNQILRDVLGLEATVPLWVEQRIDELAGRYVGRVLTRESVQDLRQELAQLGLSDVFPEAAERFLIRDPPS
jgi:predicted ATPase